jgi:hypothetical protein
VLANALFYGSIPAFALYFYLFQRTFRVLDAEERRRFIQEAALPTWRRVLALLPVPLMLIISNTQVRVALVVWFLVQLALDTRMQHKKLVHLGFDARFRDRLARVSVLAGVVVILFISGLLLRSGAA